MDQLLVSSFLPCLFKFSLPRSAENTFLMRFPKRQLTLECHESLMRDKADSKTTQGKTRWTHKTFILTHYANINQKMFWGINRVHGTERANLFQSVTHMCHTHPRVTHTRETRRWRNVWFTFTSFITSLVQRTIRLINCADKKMKSQLWIFRVLRCENSHFWWSRPINF